MLLCSWPARTGDLALHSSERYHQKLTCKLFYRAAHMVGLGEITLSNVVRKRPATIDQPLPPQPAPLHLKPKDNLGLPRGYVLVPWQRRVDALCCRTHIEWMGR